MSQPNEHTDTQKDDRLADFTDQVLAGKPPQPASHLDEELGGLEKTILHLSDTFPPETLNEAAVRQRLVRFKARVRREDQNAKPSFWKRWFDFQSNPQVGMILAAVAVMILLVIGIPALQPPGSSTMGTAFSGGTFFIGLGLIGILLVIYWITRRK